MATSIKVSGEKREEDDSGKSMCVVRVCACTARINTPWQSRALVFKISNDCSNDLLKYQNPFFEK